MSEFWCLDTGYSIQRLATVVSSDVIDERVFCPVNPRPEHQSWTPRALASLISPQVTVEVRHNKRDRRIIWSFGHDHCIFHEQVVRDMQRQGFNGFSARSAKVRFCDGILSDEYQRVRVTGWGGVARVESGIRLLADCPGLQ
jgi:hypothetical protein